MYKGDVWLNLILIVKGVLWLFEIILDENVFLEFFFLSKIGN